ncbi:hypothetical protein M2281_001627 [Mesorhizobium soli]|uniref:hypothetical protein n=1 Tax=Pseudaminobacter soli (ex Li et al. 2025) TaxID=1295366 RepID=UPI002473E7AE|nr:hypothetical protein [Mesorhizobium soli]MDH6231055.1 hypothetical protein [Mesorhizobium soli]
MATLTLASKAQGSKTIISAFIGGRLDKEIFYDIDGDVTVSDAGFGNGATVAFLPYAMRHGLHLRIEDPVDADLLEKLDEAQDAWSRLHPTVFRRVDIHAENPRPTALAMDRSAVMAFSGGLDASYALHAHKRRLIGRRALDVKAGVLIHGFDLPLHQPDWFSPAVRRASAILANYDIPLVTVRTNWRLLDVPWEQSHIFGIASVLHQFKGRVSHGVIAADSAYDGDDLKWGSNSVTNQMMSGSSFPISFTGAGQSRTEKAGALVGEQAILNSLRVCWERPESLGNCGVCEKCIRTKLNFMAHGITDVPSLGAEPTPAQIRDIRITSQALLSLYVELQAHSWTDQPTIKRTLSQLVARGTKGPSKLGKLFRKYRRSIEKRLPFF